MARSCTPGCETRTIRIAGRNLALLVAISMTAVVTEACATIPDTGARLSTYRDEQMKLGRLRDVRLDGYTYCFLEAGTGPALVLLHGIGGSLYDWRHVVDDLSQEHRVIALDLLGAGESSMPSSGDYSVFAQARRVKGLLDLLEIEKATLVGNSYGGGVAIAFAQDWPERLAGLVLIDAACYAEEIPWYVDLSHVPGAVDIAQILPVKNRVEKVLRGCYRDPERLTSEEVANYAQEFAPAARRASAVRTVRALIPDDLTEFHARLRSIEIDTLIIWGDSDDVIPPKLGMRLERDLPNARLVELQAGHVPNQECPRKVVELVRQYVAR